MHLLNFLYSLILVVTIANTAIAKDYNIMDFGAKSDTSNICTKAIQEAIDACYTDGGGRVIIPAGNFKSGTIIFKDNVELHFENGAILWGSKNLYDYPGIKPKYVSLRTQGKTRQLIYAENASNIAISGLGEINGQGKSFKRQHREDEGVLRPHLIRFITCKNIRVQDISLKNSAAWMEHYLACEQIQIRGIKINNHCNYNNDGIDLDGCRDVTVSDVLSDSDDDGITLKSTSPRPCENITITNCIISSHCNAIKMGTETNGGFKNITISNCVVKPSEYANKKSQKTCIYGKIDGITGISLEIVDGGIMDGVCFSNIRIEGTHSPIFVRLANRARTYKKETPITSIGEIKNLSLNNISIHSNKNLGCSITGIPGHPVENLQISNISFYQIGNGKKEDILKKIPEKEKAYPEGTMFGVLPSCGFYVRHARNISFNGGDISMKQSDARPFFVFDDVEEGKISGLRMKNESSSESAIWLNNSKDILINGCKLKGSPKYLVKVSGTLSHSIYLNGNILLKETKLTLPENLLNKKVKEIK